MGEICNKVVDRHRSSMGHFFSCLDIWFDIFYGCSKALLDKVGISKGILNIFCFFASSVLTVLLRNLDVNFIIRLPIKGISLCLYAYLGLKFNVITMDNYRLIRNAIPIKQKSYVL